jgi:hypothetical protein
MCQACLALASRRRRDAEDDGAGWLQPAASRFGGTAQWADEVSADDEPAEADPKAESGG